MRPGPHGYRIRVPAFQDQAVALRVWEFSETSQTVSLLCRGGGTVRGLAKGSRREGSRFDGGFEPLTLGQVCGVTGSDGGLATLTDWSVQRVFRGVRRDLTAHYAGLYLADLAHHAILDADPHPRVFDALVEGLSRLDDPSSAPAVVLRFQWRLLVEVGYKPRLEEAGEASERGFVWFDALKGRVVGARESAEYGVRDAGPWRVRRGTIAALRALESAEAGQLATPRASAGVVLGAARLLAEYLRVVLDRDLPTRAMLFRALARPVVGGRAPNRR